MTKKITKKKPSCVAQCPTSSLIWLTLITLNSACLFWQFFLRAPHLEGVIISRSSGKIVDERLPDEGSYDAVVNSRGVLMNVTSGQSVHCLPFAAVGTRSRSLYPLLRRADLSFKEAVTRWNDAVSQLKRFSLEFDVMMSYLTQEHHNHPAVGDFCVANTRYLGDAVSFPVRKFHEIFAQLQEHLGVIQTKNCWPTLNGFLREDFQPVLQQIKAALDANDYEAMARQAEKLKTLAWPEKDVFPPEIESYKNIIEKLANQLLSQSFQTVEMLRRQCEVLKGDTQALLVKQEAFFSEKPRAIKEITKQGADTEPAHEQLNQFLQSIQTFRKTLLEIGQAKQIGLTSLDETVEALSCLTERLEHEVKELQASPYDPSRRQAVSQVLRQMQSEIEMREAQSEDEKFVKTIEMLEANQQLVLEGLFAKFSLFSRSNPVTQTMNRHERENVKRQQQQQYQKQQKHQPSQSNQHFSRR